MLVYHAINPIAFEIGPVKVHWYGIMYLIGFAAGWWLARLRAARPGSTWKASDVDDFVFYAMLGVILGGRIGNFIHAELGGKPTNVAWGFKVDGQVRHASQLYEAFLEGLVLFVVLWWFTSRPRPRLAPSGLFLVIYGTARSLIEFVRVPDEHLGYLVAGWVTMGQILSFPMIIVGFILLAVAYQRRVPSGNISP